MLTPKSAVKRSFEQELLTATWLLTHGAGWSQHLEMSPLHNLALEKKASFGCTKRVLHVMFYFFHIYLKTLEFTFISLFYHHILCDASMSLDYFISCQLLKLWISF